MVTEWHKEAEHALNRRDYRLAHELCLKILTAEPEHADALFLLGVVAAEHRNFGKAVEIIDRALALAPAKPEYWAQRGRCLLSLQRPREGFEAAQRALELDPHDALTLDTIGVVMTRAGAHTEAVEPFRRAVARDSTKAPYHYNLGASLQFSGALQDAELEYREALRRDPTYHRAWSSLAQVARAPLTPADVATLERALEQPGLDADAELHLCHALAKQHEDEGRYDAAFRLLERGKRRKAAALGYGFAADGSLFAAAARLPAALAARAGDGHGHGSHEPIFIVGMPRTGTTLVERILSSHPKVFSAGELTNFGLVLKRATATASNRVLDAETLDASARCDFAAVGEAYVESTRPRTGHKQRFIDKMPLNFFYAPLIRRCLPNAKIVCLRRNPLDTCLSNYRQLFATSFSYYNYAYDLLDTGRYYAAFHALAALWRESLADNYLEVRYEDVVDRTEREARRLVEFCGLPWDSRCLEFENNAAPVATASSAQVRQPIYRSGLERWRHYERELEPLRALLSSAGVL
ncbi:MAG TPA: sulfotransferase [Gammaproteobacteria bacterium]|nr:sulfotransferase [Gammaproteobacteria bacterium]